MPASQTEPPQPPEPPATPAGNQRQGVGRRGRDQSITL